MNFILKKTFFFALVLVLVVSYLNIMALKDWSYNLMTDKLLSRTIELIEVSEQDLMDYTIFDTRGINEYQVSHLPNAIHLDTIDKLNNLLIELDVSKPILVYCSIGYRSEKIGEQLQNYNSDLRVYNLKGGVIQWVNDEKSIVDLKGQTTNRIHTYNKAWGIWVQRGDKVN